MTLLSIREQEAVKTAQGVYESALQTWAELGENKSVARHALAELRVLRARNAYTQAVILATRDAIARQVRERAEWTLTNHAPGESGCDAKWFLLDAATFIEGLPCE